MVKGMLFFMIGLILAMGGVGGVETSLTNWALFQGTVIAFCGIALMAVGVSYVNDGERNLKRRPWSLS